MWLKGKTTVTIDVRKLAKGTFSGPDKIKWKGYNTNVRHRVHCHYSPSGHQRNTRALKTQLDL